MSDIAREATPLLLDSQQDRPNGQQTIKKSLLWRLYTSHLLSTWNMRIYEFTVILLFAAAYPDTLLPTSIRGVLTNGATLLLSPAIGNWVDRHASKFGTIKATIVIQRISIVAACMLWMFLFLSPEAKAKDFGNANTDLTQTLGARFSKSFIIALIILCSVIERICAVGNTFVMERDWIPTIASEYSNPPLHELNAIMRRIDLISKILAPILASIIAIRTSSAVLAAVTAAMNIATVGIELVTARTAWQHCSVLERDRDSKPETDSPNEDQDSEETAPVVERKSSLALYFSNDAWLASMSAALQSFSVLSLSGPMTTYLLTRHYSLSLITSARTLTSVLEIGSTIIFPAAAALLTKFPSRLLPEPIAMLGLSGVTSQLLLLIPCFIALVLVPTDSPDPASNFPMLTIFIFLFLGLSRVGHWTHNIAVQQIVQTRVKAVHRVEFSGVEMTFISAAEIGRWASAAVWSRPEQFKGIAASGLASVVVIWVFFVAWALRVRRASVRDHA